MRGNRDSLPGESRSGRLATCPAPAVVIASDGRLATAAIIAAIAEGVRWTGCVGIDIGPASARVQPGQSNIWPPTEVFRGQCRRARTPSGLKFWSHGEPLSRADCSTTLRLPCSNRIGGDAIWIVPRGRSGRCHASQPRTLPQRFPSGLSCLATAAIRVGLRGAPIVAYLKELIRNVACQIVFSESSDRPGARKVSGADWRVHQHLLLVGLA